MANKQSPVPFYLGSVGLLVIAAVVTIFAFFRPQPCDIDNIYFWCRVHPFEALDMVGIVLFYTGIAYQIYLWTVHWNTWIEKKIINSLGILVLAVGFILMWIK